MSNIALKIGGTAHEGWKNINISLSIECLSGAFQLNLSDKWANSLTPRQIKPFDECKVSIDGNIVITGYVDDVEPSYDESTHGITVAGRDKAGDLIDCSVINTSGQWKGLKIEKIIEKICEPFGISVKTEVDTGEKIPTFNIEQGMSAFEAIQKLCSLRSCLAYSDGQGGIIIARAGTEKLAETLTQGNNIKRASGKYSGTERFSQYICKGQKQGDDNLSSDAITKAKAVVKDETVPRYRPLIIVGEGQMDTKKTTERAKWEASVRRGKSRTFSIMVRGWKMSNGQLWTLNKLVSIKSSWLGLSDTLLIAGINYRLDEQGELTELSLISPEAYTILPKDTISNKNNSKNDSNPYLSLKDAK